MADRRSRWACLVLVGLIGPGAGCAGDDSETSARPQASTTSITVGPPSVCGAEFAEDFDPNSLQHALVDREDLAYTTDPPTSGPHQAGPPLGGVLPEPVTRPRQVGTLEAGGVLLQHRDLDSEEHAALATLAGESVAVAPNPDLPDRVVATAWLNKQVCQGVDLPALRAFVEGHLGQGAEH